MDNNYKDAKLADIVAKNGKLETLKALQMKVAQTLDNTTSARDIAPLVKQLRELTSEITDYYGGSYYDDEIAGIIERCQSKAVRDDRGRTVY